MNQIEVGCRCGNTIYLPLRPGMSGYTRSVEEERDHYAKRLSELEAAITKTEERWPLLRIAIQEELSHVRGESRER